MVVTRDSAWWIYSDVGTLPGDMHTELPGDPTAVDHWILPHIAKAWFEESSAARQVARRAAPKQSKVASQWVVLTKNTVKHGQSWKVPVKVAKSTRLDISVVAPAGVSVEVRRPSGAVAVRQKAGSKAARQPFRSLVVKKPTPGRWTVVLHNGGGATKVLLGAALDNAKVHQNLSVARASGHRLKIRADFRSGSHLVPGARVRVYVRRVGGSLLKLALRDNGKSVDAKAHDGRYAGRTRALKPGDYAVVGKASKHGLVRFTMAATQVS